MEDKNKMREEIKRRIHEVENELQALKELVDSEAFAQVNEPELTEYEESVRCTIVKHLTWHDPNGSGMSSTVFIGNDTTKELASDLLELAKKEICKGCTVGLDQYWKGRDDERKEAASSCTFHYPTYEPPCFHGGVCINPMRDCVNCPRVQMPTPNIATTSGTCKKED